MADPVAVFPGAAAARADRHHPVPLGALDASFFSFSWYLYGRPARELRRTAANCRQIACATHNHSWAFLLFFFLFFLCLISPVDYRRSIAPPSLFLRRRRDDSSVFSQPSSPPRAYLMRPALTNTGPPLINHALVCSSFSCPPTSPIHPPNNSPSLSIKAAVLFSGPSVAHAVASTSWLALPG